MISFHDLLRRDATRLGHALGLATREARLEVRVLLGHALGQSPSWLIAHEHDSLPSLAVSRYQALLERRLAGEPIAYIVGEKEFYGRMFKVTPDVLIPRPETELLVELALEQCRGIEFPNLLDLGTGSGCIAISLALECPAARVTAVDASPAALVIARKNTDLNAARLEFIAGHWFDNLAGRRFDLIVANPPYIAPDDVHLRQGDVRHEPLGALVAEEDGLADIRCIVGQAKPYLALGGKLLIEHGYRQAGAVREMLSRAGYERIETWRDLAGHERVTGATMSELLT